MFKNMKKNKGFTLIEILVVIGIIAILATIVIIAINPARQFAQTRNTQRTSHVSSILNAIGQNIADNKGLFSCADQPTASSTNITSSGGKNLMPCLVPTYISQVLFDPQTGFGTTTSSYDTRYAVSKDTTTGRIIVQALDAELGQTISITR